MLRAASLVFALCVSGATFAQSAEINGLDSYRLGMTRAEAEVARPGRWGELVVGPINGAPSEFRPLGETIAPGIELGGSSYGVRLVFRDDALRVISLEHVRQGRQRDCAPHFTNVLSQLETEFGPLIGGETPWDARDQQGVEHQTGGGSRYRVYEPNGRGWRARANSGESYRLQVSALHIPPGGRGGCIVTISIRDDYGVGPDFTPEAPPSLEALATAPLFENARSITLPGFEDLLSLMPRFAQDNELFGGARMECLVRDDRTYWCRVMEETPVGLGFGLSALAALQFVRAAPVDQGGAPPGSRVVRRLTFADPR